MTETELRVRLSCIAEELREIQARLMVLIDFTHDSGLMTEMDFCASSINGVAEALEAITRVESEIAVVNRQLRDSLYMLHEQEQVNPKELINTKPENLREFKRCEDIGGAK